jgi:hypothetical protein
LDLGSGVDFRMLKLSKKARLKQKAAALGWT